MKKRNTSQNTAECGSLPYTNILNDRTAGHTSIDGIAALTVEYRFTRRAVMGAAAVQTGNRNTLDGTAAETMLQLLTDITWDHARGSNLPHGVYVHAH